jgi:hypothetical protein
MGGKRIIVAGFEVSRFYSILLVVIIIIPLLVPSLLSRSHNKSVVNATMMQQYNTL